MCTWGLSNATLKRKGLLWDSDGDLGVWSSWLWRLDFRGRSETTDAVSTDDFSPQHDPSDDVKKQRKELLPVEKF